MAARILRALSICIALVACGDDDDASEPADAGGPRDAGSSPDAESPPDAGRPDSGGGTRLDALAGRYLMRWDVLANATSDSPIGGQIEIRTRVSTLLVAELAVDGDKLSAKERVCTQEIKQRCLMGCDSARSTLDPRVVDEFLPTRQQQRTYTLSADGTFRGLRSVAQLGYDDPNLDAAPPTSSSDPRVWDVVPGDDVREGLLTDIRVSLLLSIDCKAYGTQKFVSSFGGVLGGTAAAPLIPEMVLDTEEADFTRLGSDNPICAAQEVDSPLDIQNARMVRYGDALSEDEFWRCPSVAVFDQQLVPTEPSL